MANKREIGMETLKFIMCSTFYPPYSFGGDAMHVYYLANTLAKLGHEVDVVFNRGLYNLRSSDRCNRDIYPNHDGVHLHPLTSRFEKFSRFSLYTLGSYYPSTKQIPKIVSSVKPDVIHYHNISGLGLSTLETSAPCLLYTAHDYWLICPLSSLMSPDNSFCTNRSNCLKCAILSKRPPQFWRYYRSLKKNMRRVDSIITPSNFMKDILSQYDFLTSITPILNFVPQPPEITEPLCDSRYFLYVGVLSSFKGIENLINAYTSICEKVDASLIIVGDGPLRTKLQEIVIQNSLQNKIKLLGKINYNVLIALYQNAIATIIPSIWPENCPLVALESFSCGTPIIAANSGGLTEIVNISKAGFLFEKNCIDSLSKLMIQIANGNRIRNDLKQNAICAYHEHFSPEIYVKSYLALIDEQTI